MYRLRWYCWAILNGGRFGDLRTIYQGCRALPFALAGLSCFISCIGTLPAIIFRCVVALMPLMDSKDLFMSWSRIGLTKVTTGWFRTVHSLQQELCCYPYAGSSRDDLPAVQHHAILHWWHDTNFANSQLREAQQLTVSKGRQYTDGNIQLACAETNPRRCWVSKQVQNQSSADSGRLPIVTQVTPNAEAALTAGLVHNRRRGSCWTTLLAAWSIHHYLFW